MTAQKLDDSMDRRPIEPEELRVLFDKQREEIRQIVAAAVAAAVAESVQGIGCPLPPHIRQHTLHLYGVLADVGDGEIDRGIRRVRADHEHWRVWSESLDERTKNHTFVSKVRRRSEHFGSGAIATGIGVIVVALIYAGWNLLEWFATKGNGGS